MPSNTPLTDAINALTTYANETTGASDTTLSDAVGTLVAGYGGGGGIDVNAFADGSISGAVEITASYIRDNFFKELTHITSLSCPNVTQLRAGFASSCYNLMSVSCPRATSVQSTQQFISCTSLTSVNLPLLAVPGGNMFQNCTSLEFIDLPSVERMNVSRVFYGCSKLKTVVLRHNSVVSINNDCFTNTPFAGYNGLTGKCYVPSSLISSYQSAANWSTLYNNGTCEFVAIEGSEYE